MRGPEMKCTYCGGLDFIEGPSGGMSTNVLCANPDCRHWFNSTPGISFVDLDKVEPTADEAAEKDSREAAKLDADIRDRMMQGQALFNAGRPVLKCFAKQRARCTSPSHEDMNRLAGYLVAAACHERIEESLPLTAYASGELPQVGDIVSSSAEGEGEVASINAPFVCVRNSWYSRQLLSLLPTTLKRLDAFTR